MKARAQLLRWTCLTTAALVMGGMATVRAQAPRKVEFSVKRIEVRFDRPPVVGGGGPAGRGAREAGQVPWGVLECEFDSQLEWADDVVVKWYVLLTGPRGKTLATGDDTYIYVKKGRRHVAGMFMHPFVLERFTGSAGQSSIEDVGVEIWYQDRPITWSSWRSQAKTQWWNASFTRQSGLLMRVLESPWLLGGFTDYEWSKHTTSKASP